MEIKRVCNPGWKNCKMSELRAHIAELKADIQIWKRDNIKLSTRITELEGAVKFLWALIDDIDTASDIAKSDDVWYRKRVECLQSKRWATGITTDGYVLDTAKLTDKKYQDTFDAADRRRESE